MRRALTLVLVGSLFLLPVCMLAQKSDDGTKESRSHSTSRQFAMKTIPPFVTLPNAVRRSLQLKDMETVKLAVESCLCCPVTGI